MKKKIHVGFVVNYFVPAGLENFVLILLNHLDRKKFVPHLYVFYEIDEEFCARVRDDVPIFLANRKTAHDLKAIFRLVRKIRKDGLDILQVHNWSTFLEGAFVRFLNPQVKLVHVQQGMEYELTLRASAFKRKLRKVLRKLIMHFFSAAVGCSGQAMAFLRKEWGAQKALLIYNSVDTNKFNGTINPHPPLQVDGHFTVCTVGRIVPVKNFLCLFKAINILKEKIPEIKLYHIGTAPPKGERHDKILYDFLQQNKLEKYVKFLGIRNDLPKLLGIFDVFALVSFSEGLSFSLLEAQACGVPAVVTNVGGNPEVVKDGVNGYLVPSNDEKAVAKAIYRLYLDEEKRKKMGFQAKKIVRKKFSILNMVNQYELLYTYLDEKN